MGSVDVVSTGNQTGEFKTTKVRFDQKLRPGFGGSVRVRRFEDVFFRHGIGFEIFTFAVNFIGRNMDEPFDAGTIFGAF